MESVSEERITKSEQELQDLSKRSTRRVTNERLADCTPRCHSLFILYHA